MAQNEKSTAAQLKHDIDSGLTHEVRQFDAAAAPPRRDEETAGTLTPGDALMRVREQQKSLAALDRQNPQPQDGSRAVFGWPMLLLFAAIALGILLSFLGH